MATLTEQIAAIRARTDLTDAQKRKAIHDLKAGAVRDMVVNGDGGTVQPFIGRSFAFPWNGATYTIKVTNCTIDGFGLLCLQAEITKGGVTKVIVRHIGNPPIISGGTENVAAAAAEMIASLWEAE